MARAQHPIEEIETELEIEEDLPLHKRGWILQRVGWVVILAFLLLAGLGFFGDGALSKREIQAGGVTVKYERFLRNEAHMELKIDLTASGQAIISFPNEYLKKFELNTVVPDPEETLVSGNRISCIFKAQGPTSIVFYMMPQGPGTHSGQVQVNQSVFPLNHFIFP